MFPLCQTFSLRAQYVDDDNSNNPSCRDSCFNSLCLVFRERFSTQIPVPTNGVPSSLPASLPPLNVSPPSLGTFSKGRPGELTQTPDPSSFNPPSKPFTLRAQKSTSFEFTGRRSSSQKTGGQSRPVITVSAPPQNVQDQGDVFNERRGSSQAPGLRFTRKPLSNPFSHKKDSPPKAVPPSPAETGSPALPSAMHFPVPPSRPPVSSAQQEKSIYHRGSSDRQSQHTVTSPTSLNFPRDSSHTERLSRDASGNLSPINTQFLLPGDTPESSPTRSRHMTSPSGPVPHHAIPRPISSTSSKSAPPIGAPPPKVLRRGSRSPSPARTPPTAPLPDLPPEAEVDSKSAPASARTPDSASQSPITSVPTIPSLPSVSTRRSITSLQTKVFRSRAQTVAVPQADSLTHDERRRDGAGDDGKVSHCIPSFVHGRHAPTPPEKDKGRPKQPTTASPERTRKSSNTASSAPPHDAKALLELQAAHERYIVSLRESHAAEKAELLRRIDLLERDARKREREIKGLRWLVMNASGHGTQSESGDMSSSTMPTNRSSPSSTAIPRRFRSGSKSSQLSQASSGITPYVEATPALSTVYSPRGSTEEGLYDLQSTVSDLIAPPSVTPPTSSPMQVNPTDGATSRRLRRANTMPDGMPLPTFVKTPTTKQARRTSSPVLPMPTTPIPPTPSGTLLRKTASGAGLGIEVSRSAPSMSNSDSQNYSSAESSSSRSSALTIPSLASTNTSVSAAGLSAIPETPSRYRSKQSHHDSEKRDREERRTSKAMKRISSSSTHSSIAPASSAHANNLKFGKSPSIGQVLDRNSASEMDEVLKKLQTFGTN